MTQAMTLLELLKANLATFADKPDTDFQRGYLQALLDLQDEFDKENKKKIVH